MKTFKQSIISIAIGLILAAGVSFASHGPWHGAAVNPPNENAPAPINVSSAKQIKTGGLGLGFASSDISKVPASGLGVQGPSSFRGMVQFLNETSFEEGSKAIFKEGSVLRIIPNKDKGKVLTSDETGNATWQDLPSASTAGEHGKKLFTTSGTWTVPNGVTTVWVSMSGGGGGGTVGGSDQSGNSYSGEGGGGAHAVMAQEVSVISGTNIQIKVGAGGAGGGTAVRGSGGDDGQKGGTSSFGSYISTPGGDGGKFYTVNKFAAAGGTGGTDSEAGALVIGEALYITGGGIGGGSIFGSGGPSAVTVGKRGGGYGGGGGGGRGIQPGGNGAPGFVLVEW